MSVPNVVILHLRHETEWRFLLPSDSEWNGPMNEDMAARVSAQCARIIKRNDPQCDVHVTFQTRTAGWADLVDGPARVRAGEWADSAVDPSRQVWPDSEGPS